MRRNPTTTTTTNSNLLRLCLVSVVAVVFLLAAQRTSSSSYDTPLTMRGLRVTSSTSAAPPARTLVVYVYHESNEWYKENLRYFLRMALQPDYDSNLVDYVLAINGETELPLDTLLYATSAYREGRVRVLQRPNTCYDGGTIGEVLRAHPSLATAYRFFVFLNSSVRGPFLPRYFPHTVAGAWTTVLTSLLTDDVKLVGTTLSCQGQVHIQSMVLATDWVGLGVLQARDVFKCTTTLMGAMHTYELQASAAILDAGYNIESLMTRYRGVDWRTHRDLTCNGGMNPQGQQMNDGMGLDPFEVVFIKAKEFPRVASTQQFLARYTDYGMGRDNITSNLFLSPQVQLALAEERAELHRRVERCNATFDVEFYFRHNPDLNGAVSQANAINHFNEYGFSERRAYRFQSPLKAQRDTKARRDTENEEEEEEEQDDCQF